MVHHVDKARKRRKPLITTHKKNTFKQTEKEINTFLKTGKKRVRDREGYAWSHVMTTDVGEATRLGLFYKGMKVDYKIVKNGDQYEVFVRRD